MWKLDDAPQLDTGTFGITQFDPQGPNPLTSYPTAWAWRVDHPNHPNREIWMFYKLGRPEGYTEPGTDLPEVFLHVKWLLHHNPPNTNPDDGIDDLDYAAFRDWAIFIYADEHGMPNVTHADLTITDHLGTVHEV